MVLIDLLTQASGRETLQVGSQRRLGAVIGAVAVALSILGVAYIVGARIVPTPAPPALPVSTVPQDPPQTMDQLIAGIVARDLVPDPASQRACDDLVAQARQERDTGVVNCHVRVVPRAAAGLPPGADTSSPVGRQPGS